MRGRGRVTPINVLNDDVLLAIFDFCVAGVGNQDRKRAIEGWQLLVHVCRRWRSLVFGSPCRLNLRLVCTVRMPARKSLDVWPALHLLIRGVVPSTSAAVDGIVTALGHRDRVFRIDLLVNEGSQWDKVLATMQVPFPALTDLLLQCEDETAPAIPDTFLGGSAPRLRHLELECISFPGIPNLLLSATHLVYLYLHYIPHSGSGYISPEAMVTCLSVLTRLDTLSLKFQPSQSRPDRKNRRLPPITRFLLPDLTRFSFKGPSEYLEHLVAQIDAPRLHNISITFLHQVNSDIPHLVQFINRTPSFEEPNEAIVGFDFGNADVRLLSWTSENCVEISCEESDHQLSSMAQVCTMCFPPLSTVETLRVFNKNPYSKLDREDDVENNKWLELLRLFTGVKSLYLSRLFQPRIASALQELVGGRTREVLPSLQNIFLERFEPSGRFQEAIGQFVAARQLSGHPIAVLCW